MPDFYRIVATTNRHTDWTSGVVLERDDDGNVTKQVSSDRPAQLTAEDRKTVEKLGYSLETVSKEDAEKAERSAVGSDVAAAGPLFDKSDKSDKK